MSRGRGRGAEGLARRHRRGGPSRRDGGRAAGAAVVETVVVLAAAGIVACAPAPPLEAPSAGLASPPGLRSATGEASAVRSGSLRQDQISVRMTAGDLLIEVTPLAPWVLEAAAPDTRRRLERIAAAHRRALGEQTEEERAVFFLVAFSTDRSAATFEPGDLHLISRGLRERPVSVEPITPNWGSRQLPQRGAALAVYAYRGAVDLSRELVVAYQGTEDASWGRILATIEAERARTSSAARVS